MESESEAVSHHGTFWEDGLNGLPYEVGAIAGPQVTEISIGNMRNHTQCSKLLITKTLIYKFSLPMNKTETQLYC